MVKRLFTIFTFGMLLVSHSFGQDTFHELAQDTIVTRPAFLGNVYLLDGKRINLQVMQWFMTDHPLAYDQIRGAAVTDQMAVIGYTAGGLIFLSGYLIGQQDQGTGNDLMLMGGAGLGAGFFLTLISNGYKRRAVLFYNKDIRQFHQKDKNVGLKFGIGENGFTLAASFY
ncbi:MAG: hypothetical protein KDD02_09435 [Phaeodactylibacter sp.]|nr:hypothetical protein [Phaeodactylibacter sp.]MCB9302829.1 hypothetical protein [Lewinellaceae bacterium]HQU59016.1 hypothetical protein [Saprospiraceae bacterium]